MPEDVLSKIKDNIYNSIIHGFYCITYIEYMVAGKTFLEYINLFLPNGCQKNGKII